MVKWSILVLALILGVGVGFSAAGAGVEDLRLDRVPLYQAVKVVYGDVLRESYVAEEFVVNSEALLGIDLHGLDDARLRVVFDAVLSTYGVSVQRVDGVTRLGRPEKKEGVVADVEFVAYRPMYRTVAYLTQALRGLVAGGRFGGVGGGAAPGSYGGEVGPSGASDAGGPRGRPASGGAGAAVGGGVGSVSNVVPGQGVIGGAADVLLYVGGAREVEEVKRVLPGLDVEAREVSVLATVYEVDVSAGDSSAVSLAVGLLAGRFNLAIGAAGAVSSMLGVSWGEFNAGLNWLAGDSRFRQVSSASLRVRSGESARMSVGSEVPVLGGTTVTGSGLSTQSVRYQSAGVILTLKPVVLEKTVELAITQELSSAASTSTGVSGSPTFNRRALQTVVGARSGDVVVLGGLSDAQSDGAASGAAFLPRWMWGNSSSRRGVEVVILLRVESVSGGV